MDFSKKIVVVTGASGALGSIIAETFLRHGASVVAVGRDAEKIKLTHQPEHQLVKLSADVTHETHVISLFNTVQKDLGGLDILVHTVGGFLGGQNIQNTSAAAWDNMMSLNLRSAFLCSKSALPQMETKGGGKIVTISALAALEVKANRAAYLTSKAGLIAFTQAVAEEGKSINVQANCIAPSIILTAANKRDMPDMDHSAWIKPEDIAATVLHLCSETSNSITGNIIKML
jgi:NAD(P)-dependent dehydrogenase (short-subunit alcohol dehydrogenase family)